MNYSLIGMPGCGKSTIGVVLAKILGYSFVDSDLVIQERENKLLQDIIDKDGLDCFLKCEENAILSINCDNSVIATGGSAIYSQVAMEHLKKNGKIIFLNVDRNDIETRITNLDTRGIVGAKDKTIAEIFEERMPFYEKYADIVVDCNTTEVQDTVMKVVSEIIFNKE